MQIRVLAKAWAPHPSRGTDYSFLLILDYTPRVSAVLETKKKSHLKSCILSARVMFKNRPALTGALQKNAKRKQNLQNALKTSLLCVNFKLLPLNYSLYWFTDCVCLQRGEKNTILTFKRVKKKANMKWRAEPPFCLIFDAQLSCRVSTLVTQTSDSLYWPQVLVINIHDAGACAFPISECLSFPDLSVNTFKVDVFPALLFDLESPAAL